MSLEGLLIAVLIVLAGIGLFLLILWLLFHDFLDSNVHELNERGRLEI